MAWPFRKSARRSRPTTSARSFRPGVESLEARALLTTATLTNGILLVKGTDSAETIRVRQSSGSLSVDGIKIGTVSKVSASSVTGIAVYGYGGNDVVDCDSAAVAGQQAITKSVTVYGGSGDDTVFGGEGGDKLVGEAGADFLAGRGGKDTLDGGDGNDNLSGQAGNDSLLGGAGNDNVRGGEENDYLFGDVGDDSLYGEGGNDSVYGGGGNDYVSGSTGNDYLNGWYGNDTLRGGTGNDTLEGGDDNDTLYGEDGVDKLYGGSGHDYLNGGADNDYLDGGDGFDTYRRNGFRITDLGLTEKPKDQDIPIEPARTSANIAGAYLADQNPPTKDSMYDVKQQQSPICSFMSALAATADWTGRFPQQGSKNNDLLTPGNLKYDANSDTYGVLLYVGGKWQRYWVNGDWTESYMPGGPLWTTLYLKAYLQACHVSVYDSTGLPIDPDKWYSTTGVSWKTSDTGLTMLTGDKTIFTRTLDAQKMHDAIAAGYILVASSKSTTSWPVVHDHAYGVYDVYKESGTWYVKLYNPWGEDAPKSSGSGTQAQYGSNDGLIRVTWSVFTSNFTGYYKC